MSGSENNQSSTLSAAKEPTAVDSQKVKTTDKKVSAKTASSGKPKEPGRKSNWVLYVLVLALAGGGAYLSQQLFWLRAQLKFDAEERNTLASRLTQLQSNMENGQNLLNQADAGLQENLNLLHERLGRTAAQWALAEAEYLVAIANHRLVLARDVATAIAALQAADNRLGRLGDPEMAAVRKQIAKDINVLKSVTLPDKVGLSASLTALAEQVESLPLLQFEPSKSNKTQTSETSNQDQLTIAQSAGQSRWQSMADRVWADLKSLVVIKHHEADMRVPLLAPEQRYYLQQNLRLQLETARLALLQSDKQLYSDSLKVARDWLQRFYNTQAQPVQVALENLRKASEVDIDPVLPLPKESLHQLQRISGNGRVRSTALSDLSLNNGTNP